MLLANSDLGSGQPAIAEASRSQRSRVRRPIEEPPEFANSIRLFSGQGGDRACGYVEVCIAHNPYSLQRSKNCAFCCNATW
jgi:hypothetical protein